MSDETPENTSQEAENEAENTEVPHYPAPVDELLKLGHPKGQHWQQYRQLGIDKTHVPELIRMVGDDGLHNALNQIDGKDNPVVYAPIHAWRALGQLQAVEAAPALLAKFYRVDDYEDDWVSSEMPIIFKMLGPSTLPALVDYMDPAKSHGELSRVTALESLKQIAEIYDEVDDTVKTAMCKMIEVHEQYGDVVNAYLVKYLVEDFKAVEASPAIRAVFESGNIETDFIEVYGPDHADVLLGLKPPSVLQDNPLTADLFDAEGNRIEKPFNPFAMPSMPPAGYAPSAFESGGISGANNKANKKKKAKRKQAKASKKKNRNKKKRK